MKKYLLAILFVFALLLGIPLAAFADDHWATEESVHYDITIREDGSAAFIETRTVGFHGDYEFSRYGRNYNCPENSPIIEMGVLMDGVELSPLEEPDNDNRPENTYAVEWLDAGCILTIYHRTRRDSRTFEIQYEVENVITLYDDIGEFVWDLTSAEEISDIGQLTAVVTIPEGAGEEFRIWAHGPLNGTFLKNEDSDKQANLQVVDIPTDNPVDIRVTAPATLFTGGYRKEGNYLEEVLEVEQSLADQANAERKAQEEEERRWAEMEAQWQKEKEQWERDHPFQAWLEDFQDKMFEWTGLIVLCLTFFGPFPLGIFITSKIGKQAAKRELEKLRKERHVLPYYRSLPSDIPPALADELVNYPHGDSGRQLSATIMQMSLQGLIVFLPAGKDTRIILKTGTNKPTKIEEAVLEMLHSVGGDGNSLTIREFRQYIKKNPDQARNERNVFRKAVSTDFAGRYHVRCTSYQKLDRSWLRKSRKRALFVTLISIPAAVFLYGTDYACVLVLFILVWSMVIVHAFYHGATHGVSYYAFDENSEKERSLWEAFGRFLEDFTTFDEKELPEFKVWKEYLVYAVAIGKGKKLAHQLMVRYPEETANTENDGSYFSSLCRDQMYQEAFFKELEQVAQAANEIPEPRSTGSSDADSGFGMHSSGSGDGGGFSSSDGGSDQGSGGGFAD